MFRSVFQESNTLVTSNSRKEYGSNVKNINCLRQDAMNTIQLLHLLRASFNFKFTRYSSVANSQKEYLKDIILFYFQNFHELFRPDPPPPPQPDFQNFHDDDFCPDLRILAENIEKYRRADEVSYKRFGIQLIPTRRIFVNMHINILTHQCISDEETDGQLRGYSNDHKLCPGVSKDVGIGKN